MYRVVRFIIQCALIISCTASIPSQGQSTAFKQRAFSGSLMELRGKRRVWLVVRRSTLVDASGAEESILSEAYKGENGWQSFPRTYNSIARKLNKYMKAYGSITAAQSLPEAEFVIYFNILEIRMPLGTPYAYGEMYVILNEASKPRILWKTGDKGMYAEDAINALLSALKAARGER